MAKTKSAAPKAATKTTPVKPVEKKVETAKTPIKKEDPAKTVVAEVKPAATKSATKAAPVKEAPKKAVEKKPAAKKAVKKDAPKTVAKKTVSVKSNVTLQINGIDFDPVQIQNDAIKAAQKIKADVKDVNVYINADESVAYFTVDSVGNSDYKINL